MPRTRAEVESDPEFQKLSPQARERVLARLQSPTPTAAPAAAEAPAPAAKKGALDYVPGGKLARGLFNTWLEAEKGVVAGGAHTLGGLAKLVNKIPAPGAEGRQQEDAAYIDSFIKQYGTPKGGLQDFGFLVEQLGEGAVSMLTTRGASGAGTGGRIVSTMARLSRNLPGPVRAALMPATRAAVGATSGALEGGAIRAAQTGGDPEQTGIGAALGAAGPAVVEGVLRPAAKVIAPHVLSKVIGATPKSFPAEGREVLEGARGVALDLLRHGPVNSREEFLRLATRRLDFVTSQVERYRGRGAVPGAGFVPKALRDAEEHTKLLVDGLTRAIQKSKAHGLTDALKIGPRGLLTAITGVVNPAYGATVGGAFLAEQGMQTAPIATRLARFGLEPGKSLPSAAWRAPLAARAAVKGAGGETANIVGKSQAQMHAEEFESLTQWAAAHNRTPAGAASNMRTRAEQVRNVLTEEGLSEAETTAVESLYFNNGDLSLQEAIDAVVRRVR